MDSPPLVNTPAAASKAPPPFGRITLARGHGLFVEQLDHGLRATLASRRVRCSSRSMPAPPGDR